VDYQKIGLLISTLRKEKGLTQKELADKLGITDRAISKWERGLGCPDISLLDDLSKILDISVLEILKGRRLDKDEIINNKSIIESMSFSTKNLKYKIRKYFNFASVTLILVISLMLLFYNLKSVYYLNKVYHNNSYNESEKYLFNKIEKNIEIVRNNQGIYSDEDYLKILSFVDDLEKTLKEQNSLYYFSKINYNYAEIVEYYKSHQQYSYNVYNLKDMLYQVLIKYNHDVIDNIIYYYDYTRLIIQSKFNLSEQLRYPYYYDKKVSSDIIGNITSFIYFKNYRDNMLLKDIIKVGEINE